MDLPRVLVGRRGLLAVSLELGRELYRGGPLQPGRSWFGDHNLIFPHLMVYGDIRVAGGYNTLDVNNTETDFAQLAPRVNLEVDLKLTSTERIHAFVQPFEKDGETLTFDEAVGRFHTTLLVYPREGLPELAPERWRQIYVDEVAEVWEPRLAP